MLKAILKLVDRIKKVAAIITAVCGIISFLWIIFREVQNYSIEKVDVKVTKAQVDSLTKEIDSLKDLIKNNKDLVIYEIISFELQDVIYDNVRFKKTLDGEHVYYYKDGFLYKVALDAQSNQYYYMDDDGNSQWCK